MSLRDTACYTLAVRPSAKDANMVELAEVGTASGSSGGEARYVRVKEAQEAEAYSGVIYDAYSGAKLASMGYAGVKEKKRRLDLHGPDERVEFYFSGKINFEWTFIFEGNKYRWTREVYGKDYICALERKPDPRVEICLAREADKKETARLQILHYNIDRFPNEIKDLRGLETLLSATFLCFLDAAEERAAKPPPTLQKPPLTTHASGSGGSSTSQLPPPVPEKPERTFSEEDYEAENPNEIIVGLKTNLDDHIARAVGLLEDPHTLFVVIRTRNAAAAQRALEVSLGVTRFRHREGLGDVNQYVTEEEPFKPPSPNPARSASTSRPAPPVIKLDDPAPTPPTLKTSSSIKGKPNKPKWEAPPNIAIYLSKIDLPDLKPGRRESVKGPKSSERLSPNPPPGQGKAPSPKPAVPAPGEGSVSAASSSGGISLGRLFKSAASKV